MSADIDREVEQLRAKAQSCLPQIDGELRVPGLRERVSVVRDLHGVPHIRASSLHDLWFAQGFVHAQDRLWQMEVGRRQLAGTFAEIIGEAVLESDRLVRRVGFVRAAEREWAQANEESRAVVEPYVAGVNAFLASGEPLPIEFELLGYRPSAWTPLDVVVGQKWGSFQSVPFDAKLANLALLRALGTEGFARLFPWYPPDAPVIVPPGEEAGPLDWGLRDLLERPQQGAEAVGGSNNWAVDGALTTTGKPLLAGDPHQTPTVPGSHYVCHLVCPEFAAVGVGGGGPGVNLWGHNGDVAWSLTRSGVDTQDLLIEQLDGGDPPRYLFRDEWLPVQVHREEFRVRGRDEPVVELVYETHHGPIVSGGPGQPGPALALAWGGMEPTQSFASLVPIHSARTVPEMIEAHREWGSNNGNHVFADTSGNIGYLLSGRLPRRRGGPAHVPVPGWTGEHEWEGWVPFEEMPRSVNPPSHFVNTSNNLIVRPDYPHYVSAGPFASDRAQRIASLLRSRAPHTIEGFAAIQGDLHSISGHRLAQRAARVEPATERGRHARDLLATWDGVLGAESAAAAVYEVMLAKLSAATLARFRDSLPDPKPTAGQLVSLLGRLRHAIVNDETLFLDRLPYDSWDEPLALALDAAAAYLDEELGPDGWAWGKLHFVEFRHDLGRTEREAALFTFGRLPVGGDHSTAFNTSYTPTFLRDFSGSLLDFRAVYFPLYRQIIDLADVRRSLFILPPGQSGHVASPHYADLLDDALNLRYRPLLWDEQDIEANAEGHLTLTP